MTIVRGAHKMSDFNTASEIKHFSFKDVSCLGVKLALAANDVSGIWSVQFAGGSSVFLEVAQLLK